MKVLFLSVNNMWAPHFETELELMSDHLDKGDDVYVLTCEKSLPSCTSNQERYQTACMKCRSRFWQGMEKIKLSHQNIISLNKRVTFDQIPESFNTLNELKQFKAYDAPVGVLVLSSLISELVEHNFDPLRHKKKVQDKIYTALLVYESTHQVLKKLKPGAMYLFNGRFADVGPAVWACQQLNVPFYTHERGGKMSTYVVFENNFLHTALEDIKKEIILLWAEGSPEKEVVGREWFLQRRNGVEQSWFSYAQRHIKGLLPKGFDSSKRNIAIYNSSIDEFEAFAEWEEPIYGQEHSAVTSIIQAFQQDASIHFYFRVHPRLKDIDNTQIKQLKAIEALAPSNLTFIWPEEVIDSYALMEACEKTVVFASTIGVEACFWNKPAILIGRAFYEGLDCCYKPKSHEDLIRLIQAILQPKDSAQALKYAFWEETRGIPFKKFVPTGLFAGAFLGEQIRPKFNFKDKILFKMYSRLDNYRMSKTGTN